jgi:hypothetical protein
MVYPPTFYMHLLPEEERLQVWHARDLLLQLSHYVQQFEAAVLLCQFANARVDEHRAKLETEPPDSPNRRALIRALMQDKTREWILIAHRDSVMTVYHFAKLRTYSKTAQNLEPMLTVINSTLYGVLFTAAASQIGRRHGMRLDIQLS